LIGSYWEDTQFEEKFLHTRADIASINAHSQHFIFEAPSGSTDTREILEGSADLRGTIVYTLGCHDGLCVPGVQYFKGESDIPEAFAAKGVASHLANTGFGLVGRLNTGWGEVLNINFTNYLIRGYNTGVALIKAKQDYYLNDDYHDYFDEKVMLSTNLYGLPMMKIEPEGAPAAAPKLAKGVAPLRVTRETEREKEHIIVEVKEHKLKKSGDAVYFLAPGGKLQVNYNKPALPYITVDIYSGEDVKAIILTDCEYKEVELEYPILISTPALPGERGAEGKFYSSSWYPAELTKVNKVTTRNGTSIQRLLISTAQYLQSKNRVRLYTKMEFDIYYKALPKVVELEDVVNYPNPCYPDGDPVEGERQVVKICVPPDAEGVKIHIYNIAGELVKTLDENDLAEKKGVVKNIPPEEKAKTFIWDATNSDGEEVSYGVYLYVVETENMGRSKPKKIAIIR
jgi:hypothetical protein